MTNKLLTYTAATLMALAGGASAQQGVTNDSVKIGMHADLSGPLAIWGVPATNAVRMRFDQVNEAGGVHGRQIEFIVEDTKYEVPMAARVTNKLVQREKIFAMLMGTGTSQSHAAMKILDPKGIPNLFPLTGAASMTEPFNKLHFSQFASYRDGVIASLSHFSKQGVKKVCVQSVANDYGGEIDEGVDIAVEKEGFELVYKGAHKVTEVDFAGVATAIKNTDCELLVLGTTIKDTITLYATLRQLGWDKPMVGSMVPYTPIVASAGDGKLTDGMYLASSVLAVDFDSGDEAVQKFAANYEAAYGEPATLQAQMGWVAADLTVKGLENAGPDLTVDSLIEGIEQITEYNDIFGGPSLSFGPDKHAGGDAFVLLQNQGGAWVAVEDDLEY
jgi:branched-chain amino acid transport system substrate-binding protein